MPLRYNKSVGKRTVKLTHKDESKANFCYLHDKIGPQVRIKFKRKESMGLGGWAFADDEFIDFFH